jgi:hypothetical protein|tara:strand:- start:311 stop:535 length:225 start_codon:yes stop_codon:yes gene_type:complete
MVDSITLAMIDTNIEYINDSYDLDLRVKTIHNGYRLVAKNQSHEIAFGSKRDINNHLNAIIRTIELMKFNGTIK